MSTKTSIKRIAAVAAVALTLGGFSAVSAHAVTMNIFPAVTADAVGANGVATAAAETTAVSATPTVGAYQSVTLTPGTNDSVYTITSSGVGTVFYPTLASNGANGRLTAQSSTSALFYAGATPGAAPFAAEGPLTVTVNSAVAGTTTIVFAGNGTGTKAITVTLTWGGATGVVYSSLSVAGAIDGGAAANSAYIATDADAVKTYFASKGTANAPAPAFVFTATQKDASAVNLTTNNTKVITASINGVGTFSNNSQYAYVAAGSANAQTFSLYSDGRAGTSTITFTVDGVVAKTVSVTFWGSVASYKVTTNHAYINANSVTSKVFTVQALDANGVAVPNATVYTKLNTGATSSTGASVVTTADYPVLGAYTPLTAHAGSAYVAVNPVAGSAEVDTVTFSNAATVADTTVSATATTTVSGAQAASIAWAFDKDSYQVGAPIVLTATLKDSTGTPVGDGTYTLFDAAAPALPSTLVYDSTGAAWTSVTTVTTVSGVAEFDLFAPQVVGTVSLAGTYSASTTGVAAALRGTAASISTTVGNASIEAAQAATDAAQEATDAANAAYDAANNAMDSADAATAAAQDASDNASAALAAVTSLSATVAKLVKSVAALATALTSIKKKLGVK